VRNVALIAAGLVALVAATPASAGERSFVTMDDGARIAVECEGSAVDGHGTLLIVHGGTGDRTRWLPLLPLLSAERRVCAMDRRAHGESGDSAAEYSLGREVLDVAQVVRAMPGPVVLLGHSYGGVVSLEAMLTSPAVTKLIVYEPPLQEGDRSAAQADIAANLAADHPEAAAEVFLSRIVQISPEELARMKARPAWPSLVASMPKALRQDRALDDYRWQADRFAALQVPTLILVGEKTQSPTLRLAAHDLQQALPEARLVTLVGQEHNAMDTGREDLARIVGEFLAE